MKFNLLVTKLFLYLILSVIILEGCTYNHLPESNKTIILNWYAAPANQTKDEFTTGMTWLFSYLGAKLPAEKFDKGVHFVSEHKIEINIEELGFAEFAVIHLKSLIALIKETEEYKITGGIDAGRFFALCFNSSNHYYKITGAATSFNAFSKRFKSFVYKTFACDTSAVSYSSRVLNYYVDNAITSSFFFAHQGSGYFTMGNFVQSQGTEAFDYMENGQPRFAVYNEQGILYAPSHPDEHPAGKPAKCMWCHESGMQPLIFSTADIPGYETSESFATSQQQLTANLAKYHKTTGSKLDFTNKKAHSQGEIIYLLFYEPDAKRLGEEWQMDEEEVKRLLSGIVTHTNHEYPFLKEVYHRKEVAHLAPYKSILVTDEMREASLFEPDYLK